jgi:hypothetical protein
MFKSNKKTLSNHSLTRIRELNHKQAQKRYFLKKKKRNKKTVQNTTFQYLPQIFIGASSSRRLGWLRNISLDTTQSCRISASVRCTCFVARPTFAAVSRRITSSSKATSITKKNPSRKDSTSQRAKEKRPNGTTNPNPNFVSLSETEFNGSVRKIRLRRRNGLYVKAEGERIILKTLSR